MSIHKDPANYRQISEPFANADEANAAVENFFAAVSAARQEFRIPDVLCALSINVIYSSGEGEGITYAQYGDSTKTGLLAAYVYGQEQQKLREEFNRLLAGKKATRE